MGLILQPALCCFFFFFNDTATTEIYTLSLHDALPIWGGHNQGGGGEQNAETWVLDPRSEEHTSELQSRRDLVCRLLLEKKKKQKYHHNYNTIQHQQYKTPFTVIKPYSRRHPKASQPSP